MNAQKELNPWYKMLVAFICAIILSIIFYAFDGEFQEGAFLDNLMYVMLVYVFLKVKP